MLKVLALALLITVACGDPGYYVHVRNATAERVVLTEDNIGQPSNPLTLQPGDKVGRYWIHPRSADDGRRARLIARSVAGELIYCQEFGYGDLERLSFSLTIDRVVKCAP